MPRVITRSIIDHHDLRARNDLIYFLDECSDVSRFIERGNDDGDVQTGPLVIDSAISERELMQLHISQVSLEISPGVHQGQHDENSSPKLSDWHVHQVDVCLYLRQK